MGRAEGPSDVTWGKLHAGNAKGVYGAHFGNEHVVRASCRDYEAAATQDVPAQEDDQKAGRKIQCPVLLVWSAKGLGSRFDMEGVWREWIEDGVKVETMPVGDGVGHYIAEEGHEVAGARVLEWVKTVEGS